MSRIPFKHPDCNGWAIYNKQDINVEDAKNMHVAEVKFNETNTKLVPNSAHDTVCGLKLKTSGIRNVFNSKNDSLLRSELVKQQNGGKEVCGTCVAHFYADPTHA